VKTQFSAPHLRPLSALAFALALTQYVHGAFAGEIDQSKYVQPVTLSEQWEFKLAVPGWIAGTSGLVGIHNKDTNVNVQADTVLR
jgi:hypothetical protein